MDKSQLRRLAIDFADGQMPDDEYRVRRRALIDGIVDGSVAIEREPAPVTPPGNQPQDLLAAPGKSVDGPWPLILRGAALTFFVAVAAALLWPADEAPRPAVVTPSVRVAELSPARTLVESFLARRDFAPEALAAFELQWSQLPEPERDATRGTPWFASLVRALRDEIKAQEALAGLAGGEPAAARARRVAALGDVLGVGEQLSPLDGGRAPGPSPGAPAASPAAASGSAADEPGAAAGAAAAPAPRPPTSEQLTGRQWLMDHRDSELTLQLFAVNGLDRIEQIMAAYPDLQVRILATDGALPRYRVFYGVFVDEDAARRAFAALPGDITGASGGAIVKSFAAVRDDLVGHGPPAAAAAQPAATAMYTLQLFASGNRASAESLLREFPGLPLELRELSGDAAPFRVVFGSFSSEESARDATRALPADLLSKIGRPLARPVTETGTSLAPQRPR